MGASFLARPVTDSPSEGATRPGDRNSPAAPRIAAADLCWEESDHHHLTNENEFVVDPWDAEGGARPTSTVESVSARVPEALSAGINIPDDIAPPAKIPERPQADLESRQHTTERDQFDGETEALLSDSGAVPESRDDQHWKDLVVTDDDLDHAEADLLSEAEELFYEGEPVALQGEHEPLVFGDEGEDSEDTLDLLDWEDLDSNSFGNADDEGVDEFVFGDPEHEHLDLIVKCSNTMSSPGSRLGRWSLRAKGRRHAGLARRRRRSPGCLICRACTSAMLPSAV